MNSKRWTYEDVLVWIENELNEFENQELAKIEGNLLKERLAKVQKSANTFGLIHFDFDLDNVFYNEEKGLMSVIDFDDAMYSFYSMDIEQALDSIKNELASDCLQEFKVIFLNGYREEIDVSDEMLSLMPLFRRFSNLYSYTRLLRSTKERWINEPEWLEQLRNKLNNSITLRSKEFGKTL